MKYRLFFVLFLVLSCTPQFNSIHQKKTYAAKGFAYIYNDFDFNKKIIKGRMNNEKMQISHQNLQTGTLLKIINPKNKTWGIGQIQSVSKNINYIHLEKSWKERIMTAFDLINTKYVQLIADDEFYIISAI